MGHSKGAKLAFPSASIDARIKAVLAVELIQVVHLFHFKIVY